MKKSVEAGAAERVTRAFDEAIKEAIPAPGVEEAEGGEG